jgi:tRNA 2-thiouridine synthesizing protein E
MRTTNGESVQLDSDGYLCRLEDWHEDIAIELAKQEGLELSADHWHVIHFLRMFYQNYRILPIIRLIVKALAEQIGKEKGNSAYLHQLFPAGPLKQGCKIAGLPKPGRCL